MNPLDPHQSIPAENPTTSGQAPGDEDHAADLVDIGRRTAETETRDAVTGRYVDEAYAAAVDDDETGEMLEDIARAEMDEDLDPGIAPEIGALRLELPPQE